ncbi:hypothetical protein ACHHYP_10921 [Achlya hypogyna]|uniref:Uncharacterized protein n=1 Tax=Achlya hypogyna TaxID=1202772 RepID=A0A1V9YK89_ACHHY|nr:hypothetical protein ACHHYP_10921 [Achlya hypogyna]
MAQAPPTDVFNKDTFLTSLRDGVGGDDQRRRSGANSPKGMANVRERYAQLHEVVGSLSEKITAVLVRQEKDFLAAYRAHMYNVQKELHDTKEKVTRNETIENKSEKIKLLEEERDWYRKEALRLDTFTTNMKKELKHMKDKLESIEEDRDWLEKQLKASKKQNKLLRAELEIRLANLSMQQTERTAAERPVSPPDDGVDTATNADLALPLAVIEREESFRKQIRQLKRELQQSKRDVNRLRSDNSKHDTNQLEAFFLLSIEAVKRDMVRRKTQNRDQKSTRTVIAPLKTETTTDYDPELKDFTSADRVRVIERLLAHDEVLSILYDNLFPENKPESEDATKRETRTPPVGSAVAAVRDGGGLPLDDATLSINLLLRQTQRCSFAAQAQFDARVAAMDARNTASLTKPSTEAPPPARAPEFKTRCRIPTQYDLKVESAKKNVTSSCLYRPPSLHMFRDDNPLSEVSDAEFTAKFALPDNQDIRRQIAENQEGFLTGSSVKAVLCDRFLPRGQEDFRLQLPHTNSKTGNLNLRLHVTLDQANMFSGASSREHMFRNEVPVDPRFVLEFKPSGVGQGCVDIGTQRRPEKNT